MLFDLRGKRKRVVQVVYVMLAGIFLIGFIGLGIGVGGGPGGIFDALGIGGGTNSSSGSSAFADQLSKAQERVQKHPKDEQALLTLTRYEYLTGQSQLGAPDSTTGVPTLTDDAQSEFSRAVDDWARYLAVADKPDPAVASQIAQAFVYLNDATGAAKAEAIFAKARPSQNTYGTLALYLYADGQIPAGDAAAKKAIALAPKASRKGLQKQFASLHKRAVKQKQAQKSTNASGGKKNPGEALQNPFSGLTPTPPTGAP